MIVLNTVLLACECFFGGTVLLALALLLSQGKPASLRHLLLTGAFAAMLVLPLASLLLPSHLVWTLAAPQTMTTPAVMPVAAVAAPQTSVFDLANLVIALATLWAMGVIFVVSKAAFGGVALADLYRASVPHIPQGLSAEKFRDLNWQLRIRTTPGDAGPITWGIFRPVVLLPKSSVTWSRARLEAVLLHEAAHVRRQDCLSRLIAIIACALYWPNPLVWTAARIMRRDGETAADDVVLTSGIKASAYAEHLVGLARAFAAARPSYAGVSLAMAEPAMLDARVEAILNPTRSRRAMRKSDVLKIAALGLTATAIMALARPSVAEAKPEAPADQNVVFHADKISVHDTSSKGKARRTVVTTDAADPGALHIEVSDADAVPPAPPEPPAAVVPPEPPAPPAAVAPPAPPAPPSHVTMRWHTPRMDARDRAEMEKAVALAKSQNLRTVAIDQEQIRRSVAAAHVEEKVSQAMREHAADIAQAQADIAKAQAEITKAQATVHAALAKVNISQVVAQALDKAFNEARRATKLDGAVKVEGDDDQ